MALRTYGVKKNAFNVENVSPIVPKRKKKRKPRKFEIKELPPRTTNYSTDESLLKVETNNTFDKLLKGGDFNEIKKVTNFVKYNSSESEIHSKSSNITTSYYSPIMTRSRTEKSNKILEISDSNVQNQPSLKLTSLDRPVDISLVVEHQHNEYVDKGSLSYIQLSKILKKNDSFVVNKTDSKLDSFSEAFKERMNVICSTPFKQAPQKQVLTEKLSPILKKDNDIELQPINNQELIINVEPLLFGFNSKENPCCEEFLEFHKQYMFGVEQNMQEPVILQNVNVRKRKNVNNQILKENNCAVIKEEQLEKSIANGINLFKKPQFSPCRRKTRPKTMFQQPEIERRITIQPGKKYRRTLNLLKNSIAFAGDKNKKDEEPSVLEVSMLDTYVRRKTNYRWIKTEESSILEESILETYARTQINNKLPTTEEESSIIDVSLLETYAKQKSDNKLPTTEEEPSIIDVSLLETYAKRKSGYVLPESEIIELDDSIIENLSLNNKNEEKSSYIEASLPPHVVVPVTAKDIVLRRCCQTEPLPFEKCYSKSFLENCQKIGEGVYGEVFLCKNPKGGTLVMKVIPIEGDQIVNGEHQKKYDEILSEIVIAMELSNLRNTKINKCDGFNEVQNVRCVKGRYPERLLDLWELFDETRGSENDSPIMFTDEQLYIILELDNGGQDLEAFVFNNAAQAYSMFKQTACALAVAETQLKFEHRDLHWGNILIKKVNSRETFNYYLNGRKIEVTSDGIQISIIDFTLSRIEFDGVVIFNDLGLDPELFQAEGDYQFEIYRLMQKNNCNNWQEFHPYSNILWLHYVLDKAVSSALRYKNRQSKIHKEFMGQLKKLKDEILSFNSVADFVNSTFS